MSEIGSVIEVTSKFAGDAVESEVVRHDSIVARMEQIDCEIA